MNLNNLFDKLPADLPQEHIQQLLSSRSFSLERIVSRGHSSAEGDWFDQDRSEWVLLLSGSAALLFDEGRSVLLKPGDYLTIEAHERHRVLWTDPDEDTLWLALHFDAEDDEKP